MDDNGSEFSSDSARPRGGRAYRVFVHAVAVLCGLFIFSFVALIAWLNYRAAGVTWKTIVLVLAAVLAGLESWRQTIRLN